MSKIRVYTTCFWKNDFELFNRLKLYNNGSSIWKNIELTIDSDFDVAIVLTAPFSLHNDYENRPSVTFLTEPPSSPHHQQTTDITANMYLPMPWHIYSQNYSFPIRSKHKLISAITSDLCFLEGHIKRLKFLQYIDAMVEGELDIFGRAHLGIGLLNQLKYYQGELSDKYMGLLPYQYHFACENSFIPNYFTEKLIDPILAGCLCFYDGCSNVEEFIDCQSFIRLDVNDVDKSLDVIINTIAAQGYKKQREHILSTKKRLLYELNPLNIIWAQINEKDLPNYFKL